MTASGLGTARHSQQLRPSPDTLSSWPKPHTFICVDLLLSQDHSLAPPLIVPVASLECPWPLPSMPLALGVGLANTIILHVSLPPLWPLPIQEHPAQLPAPPRH